MTRKYGDSFIIFDFDKLEEGYSHDRNKILCVSEWHQCVLLSLLRFASWPSRWIGSSTIDPRLGYPASLLREQGRYTDLKTALEYISELEDILMSDCGVEIHAGLTELAAAIAGLVLSVTQSNSQNVNCGGTSTTIINQIQGTTQGGQVIYGNDPPSTGINTGDPVPAGFASWDEYHCAAANVVTDKLIQAIRTIGAFTTFDATALAGIIGIALAGIITVPEAAIPVMIAALVVLAVSIPVLIEIADYLQTNREHVVCEFYNSQTATEAIEAFAAIIDEALAALAVGSALHAAIKTIAVILAGTDTINQIFNGTLLVSYPNADCSNCEEINCTGEFNVSPSLIDTHPERNITIISDYNDGDIRKVRFSGSGPNWPNFDIPIPPRDDNTFVKIVEYISYSGTLIALQGSWDNGDYSVTTEAEAIDKYFDFIQFLYTGTFEVEVWMTCGYHPV